MIGLCGDALWQAGIIQFLQLFRINVQAFGRTCEVQLSKMQLLMLWLGMSWHLQGHGAHPNGCRMPHLCRSWCDSWLHVLQGAAGAHGQSFGMVSWGDQSVDQACTQCCAGQLSITRPAMSCCAHGQVLGLGHARNQSCAGGIYRYVLWAPSCCSHCFSAKNNWSNCVQEQRFSHHICRPVHDNWSISFSLFHFHWHACITPQGRIGHCFLIRAIGSTSAILLLDLVSICRGFGVCHSGKISNFMFFYADFNSTGSLHSSVVPPQFCRGCRLKHVVLRQPIFQRVEHSALHCSSDQCMFHPLQPSIWPHYSASQWSWHDHIYKMLMLIAPCLGTQCCALHFVFLFETAVLPKVALWKQRLLAPNAFACDSASRLMCFAEQLSSLISFAASIIMWTWFLLLWFEGCIASPDAMITTIDEHECTFRHGYLCNSADLMSANHFCTEEHAVLFIRPFWIQRPIESASRSWLTAWMSLKPDFCTVIGMEDNAKHMFNMLRHSLEAHVHVGCNDLHDCWGFCTSNRLVKCVRFECEHMRNSEGSMVQFGVWAPTEKPEI